MSRIARIVAVGYPHHITQRGNNKQNVFRSTKDYSRYLHLFRQYSSKSNLSILAYCLMQNHVHFLVIPTSVSSMAQTFRNCNTCYVAYFNRKENATGHLWQSRYYSCVLDESHLYEAVRYVENNPVRAGITKKAEDWIWSSARYHVFGEKGILSLENLDSYIEVGSWSDYLIKRNSTDIENRLRMCTLNGRPLGNKQFTAKFEMLLGMHLPPYKIGRPKKN